MVLRLVLPCLVALTVHSAALAAGGTVGVSSSAEQPYGTTAPPTPTITTYGLCLAPQNADAFPSSPVPLVETQCHFEQTYTATSAGPSHGASCGGFTVAFGPMGDYKTNVRSHSLRAEWADAPITSASACANARIAATAHGFRCSNDDCSQGAWERIGLPRRVSGNWSANQQKCGLTIAFAIADRRYKTMNLDVYTEKLEGANMVRKRAKGTIHGKRGNGKCFEASVQPR